MSSSILSISIPVPISIDGFILSPNVKLLQINVINEDFVNSDHNPVYMKFILEK